MVTVNEKEIRHKTLASYDQHIDEYIHKKDKLDEARTESYWKGVEYFLGQLSLDQTIFEIGSGSGYDAQRIEVSGFTVIRSDASTAFIKQLIESGYKTLYYDVLDGPTPNKYPAIYANAVLLHFNDALFDQALDNIASSLEQNGHLCIGMKLGDFEGWRDKGLSGKRYFKFWNQNDLQITLQRHGYDVLNATPSEDGEFIILTAKLKT